MEIVVAVVLLVDSLVQAMQLAVGQLVLLELAHVYAHQTAVRRVILCETLALSGELYLSTTLC